MRLPPSPFGEMRSATEAEGFSGANGSVWKTPEVAFVCSAWASGWVSTMGLFGNSCRRALRRANSSHETDGFAAVVEGGVKAGGEVAGFEAGAAEDGVLGDGDALQGEESLGVDGLVDGDEVVAEAGDFLEVFEADDGEGGTGEDVFAGVLGRVGLALRGARTGGLGGVGAVGGEAFGGNGATWHKGLPSALTGSTGRGMGLLSPLLKWWGGKELFLLENQ